LPGSQPYYYYHLILHFLLQCGHLVLVQTFSFTALDEHPQRQVDAVYDRRNLPICPLLGERACSTVLGI
jgi:hypothetical protein